MARHSLPLSFAARDAAPRGWAGAAALPTSGANRGETLGKAAQPWAWVDCDWWAVCDWVLTLSRTSYRGASYHTRALEVPVTASVVDLKTGTGV